MAQQPTNPIPEPEVHRATLRQFNCPYASGDERALIWLDGFAKGIQEGGRVAREAMHEVFSK